MRRVGAPSLLVLLALGLAIFSRQATNPRAPHPGKAAPASRSSAPATELAEGDYRVERVIDGDTILLENHTRVRLLGIDSPESVKPNHPVEPFGPEASAFTRKALEGRVVRLTFDGDRLDQHGRTLALVWLGNRLINEELVRAGLARAQPQYHYSKPMKTRLVAAEAAARAEHLGIWSR